MSNAGVNFLKQHLNKPVTGSPSPFANWLNGKLTAAEKGKIKLAFTVRPEMTNPLGTLHGGVAAGIIDEVMGVAVFSVEQNDFFMTVNLHIDFFASAKLNDIIIAECEIVKEGRQLMHARCDLKSENGKILATGTSNLIRTNKKIDFDF